MKVTQKNVTIITDTHQNGQLSYRQFWVDGKCHRLDGPAVESWNKNGQLNSQEFWVNGKQVDELPVVKPLVPTCDGRTIDIDGKKYVLKLQD
jgi:hypothetical protein